METPEVDREVEAAELLLRGGCLVLSGAGVSTDSGIPDYRGPGRPVHTPMTYADFTRSANARRRYWARAHLGWPRMRDARTNTGHRALAALERAGVVQHLITQNVDGLHERAGSQRVVDLHGRLAAVRCLDCGRVTSRDTLEARLEALNPGFAAAPLPAVVDNPDGDVALPAAATESFVVADCRDCGGRLKPDVVFFGENVPKERVLTCYDLVASAPALLVVGSSLTVMSGLRFVKAAYREGVPVVIVNRGATRGDEYATVKVDDGTSEFLAGLAAQAGLAAA